MTRRLLALAALVAGSLLGTAANAADPIPVRVGIASSISDAPLFIADKKGFFSVEGLKVTLIPFASAAKMVAPLGAGQLEAGAGSASAGLYNAVARGINVKIVADKGSSPPGYGATQVLVRKDLVDSGRYKGLADLKGMKIAMNAPGVSNTSTLNDALKSVGLKYADVETVDLAFPDHLLALRNKAVDAAVTTEPTATNAVRGGYAVMAKGDDEIQPNHQISVLLYAEQFAKSQPEAARRFMKAYLRGLRFYNDALEGGRLAGPNADAVIAILMEYTPIKDPALFRAITPNGCNPDGRVNGASLRHDLAFYTEQGLITGAVDLDGIMDNSFVEAALAELGPFVPKRR